MPANEAIRVGVVIPMYNAASTIDETLTSVLSQTHAALDVVVVDDGSTDNGAAVVERRARSDARVRVVHQPNLGVAAARNHGAAVVSGDFLAFIDADDLWAPDKIAAQLAALIEGGERAGVAYSWFALIDSHSRVASLYHRPTQEGDVLAELCGENFVGNGSSLLIRRSVFDATGGFDASLRARDAQGCEDLAFCLAAAERCEFRVVQRHLLGYRVTRDNMSSDVQRMRRSAELALGVYRDRFPALSGRVQANLDGLTHWLINRALVTGRVGDAVALYRKLHVTSPRAATAHFKTLVKASLLAPQLKQTLRRLLSKPYLALEW